MWPDRVSNQGPLTYESGALPTALRGPAEVNVSGYTFKGSNFSQFYFCLPSQLASIPQAKHLFL